MRVGWWEYGTVKGSSGVSSVGWHFCDGENEKGCAACILHGEGGIANDWENAKRTGGQGKRSDAVS